jgi:carbamoyl-phosphate synthase small subunit
MNTKREQAALALSDGTVFWGTGFGAMREVSNAGLGEVVFNTSMYGYQEILTDPSYAGQILNFTTPHIGNVGCNNDDLESDNLHATGVIVRELSPQHSNYRAQQSIVQFLEERGILGITGIDTRLLTRHLRDNGAKVGAMAVGNVDTDALVDQARACDYGAIDFVRSVSCKKPYEWVELPWDAARNGYPKLPAAELSSRPHVVAVDCGVKRNILRLLLASGFRVTVVPVTTSAAEILKLKPDGIFLSNGPGDPARLDYLVQSVKECLGKVPLFGICLGHQILARALGGDTYKLKFGHRGGNHPVRDEITGKVEITVQNHGYAVDKKSLPAQVRVTHVNLNDDTVEGLDVRDLKAFSVQYHPESSPGPHDAGYLFHRFYELVRTGIVN